MVQILCAVESFSPLDVVDSRMRCLSQGDVHNIRYNAYSLYIVTYENHQKQFEYGVIACVSLWQGGIVTAERHVSRVFE